MTDTTFPLDMFPTIQAAPQDFRLLQRVPLTRQDTTFPAAINVPVGDEAPLVIVDVETTGLEAETDRIIELGLVRASYSPSAKRLTTIHDAYSRYEDPGRPIPELITRITGITDDDVAGRHIDDAWVGMMMAGDPLVLAHNAPFDCGFLEARFPAFDGQRWGCTASEIPWSELGFESRKLEYLLLKHNSFYEGHRASIDCLATAWLLALRPDGFAQLLDNVAQQTVVVRAFGAPFEVKDLLKARGYRWHPGDAGSNKCWWCEIPETSLAAEREFLDATYYQGAERAAYEFRDARRRHRNAVA